MTKYEQSERLRQLAEKVIAENGCLQHLDDPRCRIAYQMSDQEKKSGQKTVFADTEKIKDKLKAFLPYDFVITFYEPNVANLTEEKMEHLMYHELRHVGFDEEVSFFIVPHDVEDFRDVIDTWGIDWI